MSLPNGCRTMAKTVVYSDYDWSAQSIACCCFHLGHRSPRRIAHNPVDRQACRKKSSAASHS